MRISRAARLVKVRHDAPGRDALLAHQPGDAVREDARLAGARPSQHQHRPIARGDGGTLLIVENG
jgi:hypothetical protein